jgi:ligand-binding SRPBCC domain-containing protein
MITGFDPPHLFVDEQLSGPYSFWHHTHRFETKGRGTSITDEIRYLLPFGPLGTLVHTMFVRRQLTGIFDHRRQVIAEQFGDSPTHLSLL